MSKRFQPMKEFGRTTKKPKLDVSIQRGRAPGSIVPITMCTMGNNMGNKGPQSSVDNNMWDDDDDDVILLATQVAESQVAAASGVIRDFDSEMSFSDFAPQIHATTSTQRSTQQMVASGKNEVVFNMFDDDDADFAHLDETNKSQVQYKKPKNSNVIDDELLEDKDEKIFKKPELPGVTSSQMFNSQNMKSNDFGLLQVELSSQVTSETAARRKLASEKQIKFLLDRIDILKKENTKLTHDLTEHKTQMQSKNGETTLLRDELRHVKLQIQALKIEKIASTEAAKTESKTKIAELSKQVVAKDTELKLKNVEYSVMKMRHADETKRLEMSIRNESMCMISTEMELATNSVDEKIHREKIIREVMRLRVPMNNKRNVQINPKLSTMLYERSIERGTSMKQRTVFQLELENIQKLVSKLQFMNERYQLKNDEVQDFTSKVIDSVCKVFSEFWSYVHSLEFPKNRQIHPYHDYDLRSDTSDRPPLCLLQPTELFEEERGLSLRRYIAALSAICFQLPQTGRSLLNHQHGDYLLIQIAIEAIRKLGFAREICEHFGILESFADLLLNILFHMGDKAEISECELLVQLAKHLTFTRPNAWVFAGISHCMLEFYRTKVSLDFLCINSQSNSFCTDRVRSLYRFSNDSCFIQVYAGLLEIAFPLYHPLRDTHFKLLTVISCNHIQFVYYCFTNPPKFICDRMPSDEDDICLIASNTVSNTMSMGGAGLENSSSSTSTSSTSTINVASIAHRTEEQHCECYTKLCLSVVTLIYQLLRQWLFTNKESYTKEVGKVSRLSMQLLHIIFCDNYLTNLFRDSPETTKHYLSLICTWWLENAEVLEIQDWQLQFVHKLQESHFMPKLLREEGNLNNITTDMVEWVKLMNINAEIEKDYLKPYMESDVDEVLNKLNFSDCLIDKEKFFEGLKGYAYNFE